MLKKIKGWFSKQSKITPPKKTSLLFDLYGERQEYEYLKAKIAEIENVINNLPPPPDLSQYAVKNADNNFSVIQTINTSAPFIQFNRDGVRRGYVGVPSVNSNDIEMYSNYSLKLSAKHNVIITPASNYNAILDKAPTANNHITNKAYVDERIRTEIDAIPPLDLTNFAVKNQGNTFLEIQEFKKGFSVGDGSRFINVNGEGLLTSLHARNIYITGDNPTFDDNSCVTKKYVDSKLVGWKKIENDKLRNETTIQFTSTDRNRPVYEFIVFTATGAGEDRFISVKSWYRTHGTAVDPSHLVILTLSEAIYSNVPYTLYYREVASINDLPSFRKGA